MRGIFAAGVLDVFLEERFAPFDIALGTSVGASNMLSFLAGQHGRARRCFLRQMSRPEFIDARRLLRGGHAVDLDWLWDAITAEDPLDVEAAAKSAVKWAIVATSVATGKPVYATPTASETLDALKASCALPLLYRGEVRWGGEKLVDGGVSDPIAAREAYRRGARKILVIRSRAAGFVKKVGWGTAVGAWMMRREPGLAQAYRDAPARYEDAVRFLEAPPADCAIIHVAPRARLATTRTSQDPASLERDYQLGRELGRLAIAEWARAPLPTFLAPDGAATGGASAAALA